MAKAAEGRQHPDRDAQFRYINGQASEHMAVGQPVISVDAKKKENAGNRPFSHISMNWRGRPLTSHQVIVSLIAGARTCADLTVAVELDPGQYPKGIKASDQQMRDLEQNRRLRRHDWHPEWNYSLTGPRPP